ncbi:helix-turn-helix domain-containing protein [Streptomyces sp. NPDC012637]|uniref:helix-turn-helix domain-containing protein n=1 Tax=Streptomyces sp. NPDC012637 TaxID=3364842 RepID=UPI0036DFD40C
MASNHPSVPPHTSGLVHDNVRLTTHYTVVGNQLAQNHRLSLVARGLALYLQSLPAGASVGIKAIAAEVPESELRIARAMRELEAHGYLARFRERLPDGRIVPRTVSYNRPRAERTPSPETPAPKTPTPETPTPETPAPETPAPETPVEPPPPPRPPRRPGNPQPPPPAPVPEQHRPAADLLARLRLHSPRLLLAGRDIRRLAPAVTTWLERGAHPDAILRTLSAGLPDDLVHPAGLVAHRLAALLPPPLAAGPPAPDPFQTCDTCDLAFRSPTPGECGKCQATTREAA